MFPNMDTIFWEELDEFEVYFSESYSTNFDCLLSSLWNEKDAIVFLKVKNIKRLQEFMISS